MHFSFYPGIALAAIRHCKMQSISETLEADKIAIPTNSATFLRGVATRKRSARPASK
jgi:hypothetical protein